MRVAEWRFAPGAEYGWHRHEADYLVVPRADGDLMPQELGGGSRTVQIRRAASFARCAGLSDAGPQPARGLAICSRAARLTSSRPSRRSDPNRLIITVRIRYIAAPASAPPATPSAAPAIAAICACSELARRFV